MTNIYRFLMIESSSNLGLFLGGKKEVKFSSIKKINERKLGTFTGKHRISGTGNFRDWFHFDIDRPKKEKAIVLETSFKIYKRIWITPERHASVFNLLKKLVSNQ